MVGYSVPKTDYRGRELSHYYHYVTRPRPFRDRYIYPPFYGLLAITIGAFIFAPFTVLDTLVNFPL